jgi:drug/metabolite transporter (DMT)-like permease
MNEYHKAVLEITLAATLFGLIPIIVKFSSIDSYSLSLGRIIFATLFLFLWIKFNKIKLQRLKKDKLQLFFFGLFHALIIIFFFIAIKLITTAMAVILLYAGAIYLVLFSYIFLKEKIEKITVISLIISFIGLFLVFYTDKLILNWWGYLAGFLAGFFMALVYLFAKIISNKYNKMSMTYYQNLIALPLMLPLLLLAKFEFTLINLFTLIALGIFCTAIAFLLLYAGMKKIKAQKVGILLLMEVIVPIILALLLFRELPKINEIIGGVLILIGFITITIFHKQ